LSNDNQVAGEASASPAFKKTAFATLIFSHAINDMSGAFFAPLAPLITKEFGLSLTAIGLIMTIRSFAGSLPQTLFGWLIDRHPSRWWLLSTPLVVGVSGTAIGFAAGFWSLTAMLSVAALGAACYHPAAASMARDISAGRRGLVMSIYVASGRIGHAIGPIIALSLVSLLGLKGLVFALSLYALSGAALARFAPVPAAKEAAPSGKEAPSKFPRKNRWPLAILYATTIFRNMVMINLYGFLPLYFAARGETLWEGGAALTLLLVSGASGGIVGGWLSDRFGRKAVIVFSAAAVAPLLLLFLCAEGVMQFVLIPPLGIFTHAVMGVRMAYAQELMPGSPALAAGIMQGGNWFISGATLAATGAIGDMWGLDFALGLLSVVAAIEVVISLALPKDGRG
jgi:FSR family fosmidomycin resistance protein-like MFS transporter